MSASETTAAVESTIKESGQKHSESIERDGEGLNKDLANDFDGKDNTQESGPQIERRHHYDSYEEDESSAIGSPYMLPIQVPQTPE